MAPLMKARSLMGQDDKSDDNDAELLARIRRLDSKRLTPVSLRKRETQCALAMIRSRDMRVSARTKLINHDRGSVKAIGERLPTWPTH